jgi:hypothetical protein
MLACFVAGCATNGADDQRREAAIAAANGLPDPAHRLTPEQVAQLKSRLDQLRVGMGRAMALQILDLPSFNVRYYEDINTTGATFNFEHGHTLTLAWREGDYDATLRWARFDSEMWPKNSDERKEAFPPKQ